MLSPELIFLFGAAAVIWALICAYIYYELRALVVREYSVPIDDLPPALDGFTILQLSDLHAKEFGPRQQRLLDFISKYQFDMVALTGDFVDQHDRRVEPAVLLVQGLDRKPVFFVSGNHERWVKGNIKEALAEVGVDILDNRSAKIEHGDAAIQIIGISTARSLKKWLDKASVSVVDNLPRVLLAHSPNIFPAAVEAQIDLVLVGHTHGGQIRLPFVGVVYAPGQGLFPKYDYGRFFSNRTTMIVNGGLGESSLSIRVARKPEIVLVKLIVAS